MLKLSIEQKELLIALICALAIAASIGCTNRQAAEAERVITHGHSYGKRHGRPAADDPKLIVVRPDPVDKAEPGPIVQARN